MPAFMAASSSTASWQAVDVEDASSDGSESVLPPTSGISGRRKLAASLIAGVALCSIISYSRADHAHPSGVLGALLPPHPEFVSSATHMGLIQLSHISEECSNEIDKVSSNAHSTYHAAVEACEGLVWPNATDNTNSDALTNVTNGTEDPAKWAHHWRCHHASKAAWEAHHKKNRFTSGNCTDEGIMHCHLTQIYPFGDYSRTICMPDICKPINLVRDGVAIEAKAEACKTGTCTFKVACDGHPELDRTILNGTIEDDSAVGHAVVLAWVAIAFACLW